MRIGFARVVRIYRAHYEMHLKRCRILTEILCWAVFVTRCSIPKRRLKVCRRCVACMVERFLEADDPVLEQVLKWTVERDAADIRELLEWLPNAANKRDQRALLNRAQALMAELESAMNELKQLE